MSGGPDFLPDFFPELAPTPGTFQLGIFNSERLLEFIRALPVSPKENAVLVIKPCFNLEPRNYFWWVAFNHPHARVKPHKTSSSVISDLAGRHRDSGSFGIVYSSKTKPREAVRKVLKLDDQDSTEELLDSWIHAAQEFMTFCKIYPHKEFQKLRLEVVSDFEGEQFRTELCSVRMTLEDLGPQNLYQYARSPGSLCYSPNFFEKFPFFYSILGDVLIQLADLQSPEKPELERLVHLDVKPKNIVISSPGGASSLPSLPRARLIDFGAALPRSLCAEDKTFRSTFPDIRAAFFQVPNHEYVDAWSLGVALLDCLVSFDYKKNFLDWIRELLLEPISWTDEEKEDRCKSVEAAFKSKCEECRTLILGSLELLTEPLLKTHWAAAIEVILWLVEIERQKRLPAELFESMGRYLKSFSAAMWSQRGKINTGADLDSAVFDVEIPQALINRLARLYPEDLWSPENPQGYLKFSMAAFTPSAGGAGAGAGAGVVNPKNEGLYCFDSFSDFLKFFADLDINHVKTSYPYAFVIKQDPEGEISLNCKKMITKPGMDSVTESRYRANRDTFSQGSYGVVIPSKKHPGTHVKKIMFISPQEAKSGRLLMEALKEFRVFSLMNPGASQRLYLEVNDRHYSGMRRKASTEQRINIRFTFPHLGHGDLDHFLSRAYDKEVPDRLGFPADFPKKNSFKYKMICLSFIGKILGQLGNLWQEEKWAHLDVKPGNICVQYLPEKDRFEVSLIDAGAALCADARFPMFQFENFTKVRRTTYEDIETLFYKKPYTHSPAKDAFSLGVVLMDLFADIDNVNYFYDYIYYFYPPEDDEQIFSCFSCPDGDTTWAPPSLLELKFFWQENLRETSAKFLEEALSEFEGSPIFDLIRVHMTACSKLFFRLGHADPEHRMRPEDYASVSVYLTQLTEAFLSGSELLVLETLPIPEILKADLPCDLDTHVHSDPRSGAPAGAGAAAGLATVFLHRPAVLETVQEEAPDSGSGSDSFSGSGEEWELGA